MIEDWAPRTLLARFSHAWKVYLEYREDSPEWLEYVFQNKTDSLSHVGRWLDARILGRPRWRGWQAVTSKAMAFVQEYAARRRDLGLSTHVLDLSPGFAPYLRGLLTRHPQLQIIALCLRRDPRVLASGRQLAAEDRVPCLGFQAGDPFDPPSYLASSPDVILCLDGRSLCATTEQRIRLLSLWSEQLRPGGVCLIGLLPGHSSARPGGRAHTAIPREQVAAWEQSLRRVGFVDVWHAETASGAFLLHGWHLDTPRLGAQS